MDKKTIIEKTKAFLSNPEAAIYGEVMDVGKKVDLANKSAEELTQIIKDLEFIKGEKGDKGEDAYVPVKGKDYFDGENGYSPIKGVDYFDGKDGDDGTNGKDGKDGEKGKDGSPDTPDQIAEKLNTLEEQVESKVIKGLPTIEGIVAKIKKGKLIEMKDVKGMPLNMSDMRWHGGGVTQFTKLTDVPQTYVGQGTKLVRVNAAQTGLEFVAAGAGTGDVVGPNGAVNNDIAVFDTNTGKLIKDGGYTINDLNNLAIAFAIALG